MMKLWYSVPIMPPLPGGSFIIDKTDVQYA